MAQQEPDVHNFSPSSSHRLPTISGTQALQHEIRRARGIPTSLPTLDQLLSPYTGAARSRSSHVHAHVHAHVETSTVGSHAPLNGGVRRGHVTEIYGPPGVGKTTFGMQLAVNAVKAFDEDDGKVVWISTGKPMVKERLLALQVGLASQGSSVKIRIEAGIEGEMPSSPPLPAPPPPTMDWGELEEKLTYLHTTSLPHLLTMLIHPTALFPPPGTSLLIIDDLSNLLNSSFPRTWNRTTHTNNTATQQRSKQSTARRFTVLAALSTALPKLAASRHLAVVLLNSAATSLKQGQRAVLKPALSGRDWDAGVDSRVVLLRDFWPEGAKIQGEGVELMKGSGQGRGDGGGRERGVRGDGGVYRLAIVTRIGGRDVWRDGVGFVIEDGGMREVRDSNITPPDEALGVRATYETPLKQKQTLPTDLEGHQIHTDADADQRVDVGIEIPSELALDLPLRSSSPLRPGEEVFQRASQIQQTQKHQQINLAGREENTGDMRSDGSEGKMARNRKEKGILRERKRKAREIADSEDEDEQEDEEEDDQDEMLV